MSTFIWNINFLLFWRLAWIKKGNTLFFDTGWRHIGRLYFSTQVTPFDFYVIPKLKKLEKFLAKLDNSLL